MSTQHPIRVGSDPATNPPESLIELVISVEHRPALPPRQMDSALRTLADRMDAALMGVPTADLPLARVDVASFHAHGLPGAALYPVQIGNLTCTCQADVVEAVERACNAGDLGQHAYDMLGRAWAVHVDVAMVRVPGADHDDGGEPAEPPAEGAESGTGPHKA
jgi:hypothetical protein